MRILLFLLLTTVSCQKNFYLSDLETTQSELTQAEVDINNLEGQVVKLQDSLGTVLFDIAGLQDGVDDEIKLAIQTAVISVADEAYTHLGVNIPLDIFLITFDQFDDACGMGSFCSDVVPLDFSLSCFMELSPQKREEIVLHEFGHSYMNYLHPQDRESFDFPPYDPDNEPQEIMDAFLYFGEHNRTDYLDAVARFWTGENQYLFSCIDSKGLTTVYCR